MWGLFVLVLGLTDGDLLKQHGGLFEVVPEKFFRVLTGNNRFFYGDCLIYLYQAWLGARMPDFDRELVLALIADILSDYSDLHEDVDEDDEGGSESLQMQVTVIPKSLTKEYAFHRLVKTGWLELETDEHHTQLVSLTSAAAILIPALKKMSRPSKVTLGSYARNIIENLKAAQTSRHPYLDAFFIALENSRSFLSDLNRIRRIIKNDVEAVYNCNTFEEMNKMLRDYIRNLDSGEFSQAMFVDSLPRANQDLISELLTGLELNERVWEAMIREIKEYETCSSDEEAEDLLRQQVELIRSRLCNDYEDSYRQILKVQYQYIASTHTRIYGLATNGAKAGIDINRIIDGLNEIEDDDFDNDIDLPEWAEVLRLGMSLPIGSFLGESVESLYKAKAQPPARIDDVEEIPQDKPRALNTTALKQGVGIYTREYANATAKKLLNDQVFVDVAEIPVCNRDEFNALTNVFLQAGQESTRYTVAQLPGHCVVGDFSVPNFRLERKS